jgi:hypothetical protein
MSVVEQSRGTSKPSIWVRFTDSVSNVLENEVSLGYLLLIPLL